MRSGCLLRPRGLPANVAQGRETGKQTRSLRMPNFEAIVGGGGPTFLAGILARGRAAEGICPRPGKSVCTKQKAGRSHRTFGRAHCCAAAFPTQEVWSVVSLLGIFLKPDLLYAPNATPSSNYGPVCYVKPSGLT